VRICSAIVLSLLVMPCAARAQESKFRAKLRVEGEHVKESCSAFTLKKIGSCAVTLATDQPLHVSLGSIAPQNGMGFGGALVTGGAPNENWRLGWDSDAVVAPGGAWRAGTYFRAIRTAIAPPQPVPSGTAPRPITIHPYPVFSVYAQTITLPALSFYGLGSSSRRDDRTEYGMRQGIAGTSAIVPVTAGGLARLSLSLAGEFNARVIDIRPGSGDVPSIETRFSDATAPGLSSQPAFAQFGEGVLFAPALANDRLQLNYRFHWQQFLAGSPDGFRRWTVDLSHDVPLYRTSSPGARRPTNGPNECFTGPSSNACAPVTRDRWGTLTFRALASKSGVAAGNAVPFYLQRTLGGSDINGNRALPSYDDYRFRGPHMLLLQESFEHSLYGPLGIFLGADQARVAMQDEALSFRGLRQSYAAGLTLRAGGFPAVVLSVATGNAEGHHVLFTINTSLLGGSARPSLY
jgi:hypothetical protein